MPNEPRAQVEIPGTDPIRPAGSAAPWRGEPIRKRFQARYRPLLQKIRIPLDNSVKPNYLAHHPEPA